MKYLSILILFTLSGKLWSRQHEILHWWTSGSEAQSILLLKKQFEKAGHQWKDSPIAGASSAMTILKSRVIAGDPPSAAQLKGPYVREYAEEELLYSLDELAQKWQKVIPHQLNEYLSYDKKFMAIPVTLHRSNWMWVNKKILDRLKLKTPQTWEEFLKMAPKIQKAGYVPLALGGDKWQESVLFESIILSQGKEFYKNVLVDVKKEVILSQKMQDMLTLFKKVKQYTDHHLGKRSWDMTTNLVIQDKAAMQIMGDWAKGEFLLQKKIKGKDFDCVPSPGTKGTFNFVVDSFSFFKKKGQKSLDKGQKDLITFMMDKNFQEKFGLLKGSIPVRMDVDQKQFDQCGQRSFMDFADALKKNKIVPSFANDMSMSAAVSGALSDVMTQFFNSDMTAKVASEKFWKSYVEMKD